MQGTLLLKTLRLAAGEHGLSGDSESDPQRQLEVREGHQRTAIPRGASAEVVRDSDSYSGESSRTTRRGKTLPVTRSRNLANSESDLDESDRDTTDKSSDTAGADAASSSIADPHWQAGGNQSHEVNLKRTSDTASAPPSRTPRSVARCQMPVG